MENNNIHDKEDVHKFSAEYKARKERILDGIKEVEKSGDQTSKKNIMEDLDNLPRWQ